MSIVVLRLCVCVFRSLWTRVAKGKEAGKLSLIGCRNELELCQSPGSGAYEYSYKLIVSHSHSCVPPPPAVIVCCGFAPPIPGFCMALRVPVFIACTEACNGGA